MAWVAAYAAALGVVSFDLTSFCATDPPALPTIDASRIAGYFNPLNPQGAAELRADMGDLVGHFLWFDVCQCTSAPAPPAPAPLPQPTDVQTNNPTLTTSSGTPCLPQTYQNFEWQPGNGTIDGVTYIWNRQMVVNQQQTIIQTPVRWIHIRDAFYQGNAQQSLSYWPLTIRLTWYDANLTDIGHEEWVITPEMATGIPGVTWAPTGWHEANFLVPDGAYRYGMDSTSTFTWTDPSQPPSLFVDYVIDWYCTAPPAALTSNCCPPDPTIDIRLQQLYDLVLALTPTAAPGPYIDGIVHASLSGEGTIAITSSSRAIRVDVLEDLSSWPQVAQTPPYFWSLGFVTPFAVGTPLRGQRLIFNHQIFSWPTYTDMIGYTLTPGVTVNLVELA